MNPRIQVGTNWARTPRARSGTNPLEIYNGVPTSQVGKGSYGLCLLLAEQWVRKRSIPHARTRWSLPSPTLSRLARRSPERAENRKPWRPIAPKGTACVNLDSLNFWVGGAPRIGCALPSGVYLRPVSENAPDLHDKGFLLEGLKVCRSVRRNLAGLNKPKESGIEKCRSCSCGSTTCVWSTSGRHVPTTPDAAGALMCPPGRMGAYLFF